MLPSTRPQAPLVEGGREGRSGGSGEHCGASSVSPAMNRHTCKLCFRRFTNGRALGGHMRSHVSFAGGSAGGKQLQVRDAASPSSSASASHGEVEVTEEVAFQVADGEAAALVVEGEEAELSEGGKQFAYYGLRENPRKSFRLVDPEFSSTFHAVDYPTVGGGGGGVSSVVLQDRESETESSKPPSLRRRSKRRRRESPLPIAKSEPSVELEPVSSISDAASEEDVARCLMMLSRDAWGSSSPSTAAKRKRSRLEEEEEEDEEVEEEKDEEQNSDDESDEVLATVLRSKRGARSSYQCETCRKVFRSYQALGGHRASHKKVKACSAALRASTPADEEEDDDDIHPHQDADSEVNPVPSTGSTGRRIHECPVCFRIFGSGQALGGHKRSHFTILACSPGTATRSQAVETTPTTVVASPSIAASTTIASASHASAVSPADANRARKLVFESFIDLNLPPPMDEEAETSAVFDGEY